MATKEKTVKKEVAKTTTSKSTTASKPVTKTKVEECSDCKAEPKAKTGKAAKTVSHEQIRHKAYEIYVKTGCTNAHENWVKAEKELTCSK